MRFKKAIVVLLAFLACCVGCLKEEYSYEGGPAPVVDTTVGTDPLQNGLPAISCTLCQGSGPVQARQWRFLYGASPLCGPVTKAVMSPEKNALTFFGPSACSVDTGLIMTAFFDTQFDQDRTGVQAAAAAFEYYNKNAADDVFRSRRASPFTLVIDRFEAETQTAEGRFSGDAFTPDGLHIVVASGTFRVRFE